MTSTPTENENYLVFEKSKWVRKQKFFSQLISTTGSQNMGLTLLSAMEFGYVSPLKELEHFFLMSYTPPEYLILKLSQLAI